MPVFKKIAVLFFVILMAVYSNATDAPQPAEEFKQFIASPPSIAELIYSQTISNLQTQYYCVKWQRSNMFLGRSKQILNVGNISNSINYTMWIGKFGNGFSLKSRNAFFVWTNRDIEQEKSNTVANSYHNALHSEIATIFNMGCGLADIGSIHWDGDKFAVNNPMNGLRLEGKLTRDEYNRASKLIVKQSPLGKAHEDNTYFPWEYDYFYDAPLQLSYLPDRIIASFKDEKGQISGIFEYKILALTIATNQLAEDNFRLSPGQGLVQIAISNTFRVYQGNGTPYIKPDTSEGMHIQNSYRIRYFIIAFIILSLFPILLWLFASGKHRQKK
jgi:hypothetical protein